MPRGPSLKLTAAQRRVGLAIARFEHEDRLALVNDLVKELGLAAESSLTPTLQKMTRNGFIEVHGGGVRGRSRILRLTQKGRYAMGIGGLPLLGIVPAGPISDCVGHIDSVIEPTQLVPHLPSDFLLRVRGDSMSGDGILDGDLVLLRPGVSIPNGCIAAVGIGSGREGTLKRVFFEHKNVRLRASNPAYPDMLVPACDVYFAGLLKAVVRQVTTH